MSEVKLPPDSDISVKVKRGNQTECAVELLVNDKVFGSITITEATTGEFTIFGFRTPKSGDTIVNLNKTKNWNFNFTLFKNLLGLE